MKKLLRRYKFLLVLLILNILLVVLYPSIGQKSVVITGNSLLEMLSIIPPIFILLGLLDVWVQRDTMIKLMGEKSGFFGISLAFFLGSAAAGPLYAAFPIAGVLLKKGSKFSNVLVFIGAWSTTKIPLLLFEATSMGWKFMLTRFIIDIPGIALIAYTTDKLLSSKEKQYIYDNAVSMEKHI
ncbi:putative permease [Desulfosporosinus orientis DSM 765]|uniref:Putative permease n=1 Tax=Desulfosporosinus orientis (strain ATCC 19365 / DSM 765 / NCIMB 8382 / VKM B-1628 / Singapore I) TaxID=768706 RepID=G7W8X9_DESOD|nr:permease [Desulfosporosinus orientis]AET68188.1 putative permease [Desulfosporosinus orientis DSM 765]